MSQQQSLNSASESTDTPSPESSPPNQVSYGEDDDDYKYRCPFCEVSYNHEFLTRVHITRSEDLDHRNSNGFMPEIEIEVIDENETIVDKISRRPEGIDMSELSISVFPSSLSEQHRHILLVAAQNKDEEAYTTLTNEVQSRLNEYGLDCPSYSTVRRVVRQFYRPQNENFKTGNDGDSDTETLSACTPKQQAIIIARLASPTATKKQIADQVNCAKSYPSQIYDRAEPIITDLESRINQGEEVQTILRDELTDDDIRSLKEQNLLTNIPIDFDDTDDDQNGRHISDWGSPVKRHDVMTADPNSANHHGQSSDTDAIEQTDENRPDKTVSKESVDGRTTTVNTNQLVRREEIEDLLNKVAFTRQIFERVGDEDELVSLASHIETHLEEILQENPHTKP